MGVFLCGILIRAARLAENGFAIDAAYAARLADTANLLRVSPSTRALFFHADGSPLTAGEVLRQPDLARTYRAIAQHGIHYFYNGQFAIETARWMAENGGILGPVDLVSYIVGVREPLPSFYRGRAIAGFPPPAPAEWR